MEFSFRGQNSWAVTRKRSKAEERREKVGEEMEPLKACSVCHRSKTPMWRNGPDGPKSLCNACGIKYRKRRRREEMEETAKKKVGIIRSKNSVTATAMEAAAAMSEELKRRQREKQEKILMLLLRERSKRAESWRRRWSSVGMDGGGYTKEVAEAALLLLSLSSGIYIRS
ncbi:hypothetical protein HPP92_008057 [Vanilla planifolia]|uniref:GATA-type domain-containing protein n=1 Tax=Vanilla planifolia TaxID=51239 RepID=A0A835RBE2_VANPL|nr:hypothetical protein HPP92_008057 [Vanilla planifolia]